MAKLFERFSQVDASPTRKVGGTGLGLSICRQLVELHNGRIWAESEPGTSTTFTFILPVCQPEPDPAQVLAAALAGEPTRVVLAVDDDQGVVMLYRRYLEPHGYTVVGVSKSAEAITRAAELRPVVILLDVLMPGKDGWQVLAELKRSEITKDIPVIMCTLVSDPERAQGLGAADYLNKPILEPDLMRALGRLPSRAGALGRPLSVLVVDDNADDIAMLRRALAPAGDGQPGGVRLLEARDGQTGLTLARAQRPHAIILDLTMPDLSGQQVLAALRSDELTRDIPVLVVTEAELSGDDYKRLAQHAAAIHFKSSLAPEQLVSDLKRALLPGRA
jgi:CheY-like chemotaxis protein